MAFALDLCRHGVITECLSFNRTLKVILTKWWNFNCDPCLLIGNDSGVGHGLLAIVVNKGIAGSARIVQIFSASIKGGSSFQ